MAKNDEMYGCAVLGAIICVLFVLANVASYRPPDGVFEESRSRGAAAGQEDGLKAGEADAIRSKNAAAYVAAYDRVIDEARSTREYLLIPMYCALIVTGCVALGYLAQFTLFYVLRRAFVLQDIDRILMPAGSTVADLEAREDV